MLKVSELYFQYRNASGEKGLPVLDGLDLTVGSEHILSLLGPSGCGKTTTLLSIAGLIQPDDGEISYNDKLLFSKSRSINLTPAKRSIGLMFQSYAIWPHMSALQNIVFALSMSKPKMSRKDLKRAATNMLQRFGLETLADQASTKLSGGQQQRLALARALIVEPRFLLLDEPLSSVEPSLRNAVADEIRSIHKDTGICMILVTHDHQDAMALSTQIAVMDAGRIVQQGTPREIYKHPVNPFVANFFGRSNVLTARNMGRSGKSHIDLTTYETPLGRLSVPQTDIAVGETCLLSIKHTDVKVHIHTPADSQCNVYPAIIERVVFYGHSNEIFTLCNGQKIIVRGPAHTTHAEGEKIFIEIPPEKLLSYKD